MFDQTAWRGMDTWRRWSQRKYMNASAAIRDNGFVVKAAQSLRTKGLLLLVVALMFLATLAAHVVTQRVSMLSQLASLAQIHVTIEALGAVASVVEIAEHADHGERSPPAPSVKSIEKAVAAIDAAPVLRDASASLSAVRDVLLVANRQLSSDPGSATTRWVGTLELGDRIATAVLELRTRRAGMEREAHGRSDSGVAFTLAIEFLALVTISVLVWVFTNRLVVDMRAVTASVHAMGAGRIVANVSIARRDELGQLAHAIAGVGTAWTRRERNSELEHRRQSHRDMMDALGAFSKRIAHDIGNPLAGIVGMAQSIHDAKQIRQCRTQGDTCHPDVILEQAHRIARTSHQLSRWADLQGVADEPTNVNELIEHARNLLMFDRRLAGLQLTIGLEPSLPAIDAPRADIAQVFMGALFDAANRLGNAPADSCAEIRVQTGISDDGIFIDVYGSGEPTANAAACLNRCCEPEGRHDRTHERLLVAEMRGRISFTRTETGHCTRIWLPLRNDRKAKGGQ